MAYPTKLVKTIDGKHNCYEIYQVSYMFSYEYNIYRNKTYWKTTRTLDFAVKEIESYEKGGSGGCLVLLLCGFTAILLCLARII